MATHTGNLSMQRQSFRFCRFTFGETEEPLAPVMARSSSWRHSLPRKLPPVDHSSKVLIAANASPKSEQN